MGDLEPLQLCSPTSKGNCPNYVFLHLNGHRPTWFFSTSLYVLINSPFFLLLSDV